MGLESNGMEDGVFFLQLGSFVCHPVHLVGLKVQDSSGFKTHRQSGFRGDQLYSVDKPEMYNGFPHQKIFKFSADNIIYHLNQLYFNINNSS